MQDWDVNTHKRNVKIPLQRAVDKNQLSIVHYFIKECNQDFTTLDQVKIIAVHIYIQVQETIKDRKKQYNGGIIK